MEDSPCFERRLIIHLVLDLAVDISCTGFDVELISLTAAFSAHNHVAGLVLVAFQLSWIVFKLKVPKLLLLDTLRVSLEYLKEILAFLDLAVGIGMDDFGKILHESEIRSHLVS
jgi:hypothetical protein